MLPFGPFDYPLLRQPEHIGSGVRYGTQRPAVFGRERPGQLLEEIRAGHAGKIGGLATILLPN
jgi:hypothetical protein